MTFLDEEILKKREELKKEKYSNLESGIYIDGRIMTFERKNISSKFSICVPDMMKLMPLEYARIKYPSEFRPKIILTSPDLSVNCGFTIFPEEFQCDDMLKVLSHMQSTVHRSNPDYKMYPCKLLKDIQGCYFAFRSHAMDSDMYNMFLLVQVSKRLVQGSFNCYYKDYQKWEKIVLMMWNTIEIISEEV